MSTHDSVVPGGEPLEGGPNYWRTRYEAAQEAAEDYSRRLDIAEELISDLESEREDLRNQLRDAEESLKIKQNYELGGLTDDELADLQTFIKERAQGVVHTPGYILKMSALQARHDAPKYREGE